MDAVQQFALAQNKERTHFIYTYHTPIAGSKIQSWVYCNGVTGFDIYKNIVDLFESLLFYNKDNIKITIHGVTADGDIKLVYRVE